MKTKQWFDSKLKRPILSKFIFLQNLKNVNLITFIKTYIYLVSKSQQKNTCFFFVKDLLN